MLEVIKYFFFQTYNLKFSSKCILSHINKNFLSKQISGKFAIIKLISQQHM